MALYGRGKIGPYPDGGVFKAEIFLDDADFEPQGVVVTGLADPEYDENYDTFAFQVTRLLKGSVQLNVYRVDVAGGGWDQVLWVSYVAW